MRIGVIADIHANAVALKTVLSDRSVEQWLCCGDLVGYYTQANDCISMLKSKRVTCVMGNHDEALAKNKFFKLDHAAEEALKKTSLSDENLAFLKALPEKKFIDFNGIRFLLVHGKPNDSWAYAYPRDDLSDFFNQDADVILFGHTHFQTLTRKGCKIILNPGSVGQPRDADPRASYAIFDTKKKKVEFKRMAYNVDAVFDDLIAKGLTPRLGERLYSGASLGNRRLSQAGNKQFFKRVGNMLEEYRVLVMKRGLVIERGTSVVYCILLSDDTVVLSTTAKAFEWSEKIKSGLVRRGRCFVREKIFSQDEANSLCTQARAWLNH